MKHATDYLEAANAVVPRITPEQGIEIHKAGGAVFVDVRDSGDIAKTGTIAGALRIPRGFIEFAADDAHPLHNEAMDKAKEIVLVCAAGGMAALTGKTLSEMGYTKVHNVGGIGDWITGVLEKDGAPVGSVVPKEGGIQWTESYCIGKGSEKAAIVNKFIQYMLSPEGQVKSAQMAAYPGFAITKSGRAKLIEVDRKEAERTGQIDGMANDPVTLVKEGRIHYRNIPVQQTLEDWNDFWSEYKNA